MLNEADQDRIAAAVAAAEARTSGEVLCAVTEQVSDYPETPLAWAAGAALILPPLAVMAGLSLDRLANPFIGWTAAHGAAASGPFLSVYVLAQTLVFVLAMAAVSMSPVRRLLTPRGLKHRRVRAAAMQHFAGVRLHLPPERTAVLIFASLWEHQIEIVADEAIHAKVGSAVWDDAIAQALAVIPTDGAGAGLAKAVEVCGAALADHFPDDGRANDFPDRPLQI